MRASSRSAGGRGQWLAVGVGLAAAAVALAVIWVWVAVIAPRIVPVGSVQVTGALRHVEAERVRDAVRAHAAGNFFTVDVWGARRAVEALPWVRGAEVRRVWPDAVHVTVREHTPFARWAGGGLINTYGELFSVPRAEYPAPSPHPSPASGESVARGAQPGAGEEWIDLPQLAGPPNSEARVADAFRDMAAIVEPLGLTVTGVTLDERRSWSLTLNNGIRVVCGRGDMRGRLLRFVRFYNRVLAGRAEGVEQVDLRYGNGFAVRWKTGSMTHESG